MWGAAAGFQAGPRAARLLGLTRDELRYRVKKFDLSVKVEEELGPVNGGSQPV